MYLVVTMNYVDKHCGGDSSVC